MVPDMPHSVHQTRTGTHASERGYIFVEQRDSNSKTLPRPYFQHFQTRHLDPASRPAQCAWAFTNAGVTKRSPKSMTSSSSGASAGRGSKPEISFPMLNIPKSTEAVYRLHRLKFDEMQYAKWGLNTQGVLASADPQQHSCSHIHSWKTYNISKMADSHSSGWHYHHNEETTDDQHQHKTNFSV